MRITWKYNKEGQRDAKVQKLIIRHFKIGKKVGLGVTDTTDNFEAFYGN